jgi:hypothetical protein
VATTDHEKLFELKKAQDDSKRELDSAMSGPDIGIEAARKAAEKFTDASNGFTD